MTANGGDAGLAVKPVVPLLAGQTYSLLAYVCPVKAESYLHLPDADRYKTYGTILMPVKKTWRTGII